MRILITVSREADEDAVRDELLLFLDRFDTLVHGGCPTGADSVADALGNDPDHDFFAEMWPADWTTHGRAAGPIRNQQMVDSAPGLCLAFFTHGASNRGTADCVRRARAAGIVVSEHWVPNRDDGAAE